MSHTVTDTMVVMVNQMSAASPDMNDSESTALQESIKRLGQLVPIVMWRGEVIDGRKRLAACRTLGIEPVMMHIPDDATATDYAVALNLLRTQYSAAQRAMYAATLVTLAKGSNQHGDKEDVLNRTSSRVSRLEAAALVDVRPARVSDAQVIRRKGVPELVNAVERGELPLQAAAQIARTVPVAEQDALVRRAVAAKGSAKKLPPGTLAPKAPYKALPKRDATVVIGKCLANIEAACDVLEQYGANVSINGEREQWLATLDTIAGSLRRFRRRLTVEGNG